jgi:hypothetical protein
MANDNNTKKYLPAKQMIAYGTGTEKKIVS